MEFMAPCLCNLSPSKRGRGVGSKGTSVVNINDINMKTGRFVPLPLSRGCWIRPNAGGHGGRIFCHQECGLVLEGGPWKARDGEPIFCEFMLVGLG